MALHPLIGLLLLSCCAAAAAQPAPAGAPVLQAGDAWHYRVFDGYTGNPTATLDVRVIAADAQGYRIESSIGQGGPGEQQDLTPELNVRQHVDGLPEDAGYLRFPLAVGKRWKSVSWYENRSENSNGVQELDNEVVAYEKVKVPAGEFDAYRIKGSGFWKLRKPPLRRATDWSGRHERTIWYAPAIKRWVILESRSYAGGHAAPWFRAELTASELH